MPGEKEYIYILKSSNSIMRKGFTFGHKVSSSKETFKSWMVAIFLFICLFVFILNANIVLRTGLHVHGTRKTIVRSIQSSRLNGHGSRKNNTTDECWREVDWGFIRHIPSLGCVSFEASHALIDYMEYCAFPSGVQVQAYGLRSTRPLNSVKQDGADHDPRYTLEPKHVAYHCPSITGAFPCGVPAKTCDVHHTEETVLVSRRDDHNPFFMISLAFNIWLMGKQNVKVIMFDDAGPQATDDLFRKLISPDQEIEYADQMLGGTWCFDAPLWTTPPILENTGPLMMHLNDEQVCGESQMIQDFVKEVHALYPVIELGEKDDRTTVTFVGRKHYNNRKIERVWTNEREVVDALSGARPDLNVRLVYYEDIPFEEQMQVDRTTNIMVGMHGAGLVHALFLPDGSNVIEIFPETKFRWGYRNIAQYRGFTYDDFRGGRDGVRQSKTIEVSDWLRYFNKKFPAETSYQMPLVQNREISHGENKITDKILELIPDGKIFVEMGANNGKNSNTDLLESKGWSGLCIEAGPTNFKKLVMNRPMCTNVNAVVSDTEATAVFREFPSGYLFGHSGLKNARSDTQWNSLISAHHATFIDHTIRTTTLSTIFDEHNAKIIDYFSLDVEGAEMSILHNYPFEAHPVRVWSIEHDKLDRSELVAFMESKRYKCFRYDKVNTICQMQLHKI